MTKINITDIVTDNATCSTINDMDVDVASYVAADVADDMTAMWHPTWRLMWHPMWHDNCDELFCKKLN